MTEHEDELETTHKNLIYWILIGVFAILIIFIVNGIIQKLLTL